MSYDNVILRIGNFGPYQRRICLVLLLPAISCAFHKMGTAFLTARADFRCLLPNENLENATYQSPPNIANTTYPWDLKTENWPQCETYNANITDPHHTTSENVSSTKCEAFVYDKTQYTRTVTTEWDLVCDNEWLKSVSDSLFMLGDMPGVVIFGGLSDRYGRKLAMLWGAIMQLVCGLLVAVSPNFPTYMILRILVGTTNSGLLVIAYVTVLEMVTPKKRLTAGFAANLSFTVGYILSSGLGYFIRTWRYLQIAFTIPIIITLAFWWSIPESVRWLLNKGRVEEAKGILQKAALENGVELPPGTLDGLLSNESESERVPEKTSALDLFRYPNLRKKSLLLFLMWFINSITYYGLSLNTANLGGNVYLNYLISAAVEVPAHLTVLFTLDRWGRKIILCGGLLLAGMSLLLTFFVPADMSWLMKALAMIGKWAITCSWGTAYIATTEHFPTAIRNVGVGACSSIARIGGAVAPYAYYLFGISPYLPLMLFGIAALMAGLLSLLLPETLNITLPESIQDGEELGKSAREPRGDVEQSNHGDAMGLLDGKKIELHQKPNAME